VATELKIHEQMVTVVHLARGSIIADVKLLTDPTGRDDRDAAALSRALREVPLQQTLQQHTVTHCDAVQHPVAHTATRSGFVTRTLRGCFACLFAATYAATQFDAL